MTAKSHLIRLNDETYDRLRWYAFQRRLSFGAAVDDLLDVHAAATATGPIVWEVSHVTDDGADEDPQERPEFRAYTDAQGREHAEF